jgi:hypothetical protein
VGCLPRLAQIKLQAFDCITPDLAVQLAMAMEEATAEDGVWEGEAATEPAAKR